MEISIIDERLLRIEAQMSKSGARRRAFIQKINNIELDEPQPQDLSKHDWIGSTARRYGAKILEEEAAVCTKLRENTSMWNASMYIPTIILDSRHPASIIENWK